MLTSFASIDDLGLVLLLPDFEGEGEDTAQLLLDLATAAIQAQTGQQIFAKADDVISCTRSGPRTVLLPQIPVTAVAEVKDRDDVVIDAETYTWDAEGILTRTAGLAWPEGNDAIVVKYSHGYADDDIPMAARAVCIDAARRRWLGAPGISKESIGNYSVEFASPDGHGLTESEQAMLASLSARTGLG